MNFQYVPPLTPEMIPPNCYAVWNSVDAVWEFPPLSDINPVPDPIPDPIPTP